MSLQDYLAKNYGTEKKKKKKHIRGAAVTIVDRTADTKVIKPVKVNAPAPPTRGRSRARSKSPASDASPPRRRYKSPDSGSDASPPRRRHRSPGSESDASPPRRRHRSPSSGSDASPPRRRHQSPGSGSDASPPRRRYKSPDSGSDASPPRRRRSPQSDSSPPRRQKVEHTHGTHRKATCEILKEATKEDRKMTNLELINEKNKSLEQNFQWGRSGVVQRLSAEEKRQQDLKEMQKPMARYADDEDLNKWQKEQQHWGDPMLEMNKEDADDGMEEELWKGTTKDDGEKKPEKKRPLYTGPAGPPNRYKIRPGYRWDGVDRSNGFEATMFKNSNKAELRRKEHYKWSVEDM